MKCNTQQNLIRNGGISTAKKATKKAAEQLQMIFDLLGDYGGTIATSTPKTWWELDVEVETESADKMHRDVIIGVCQTVNGDVLFDPQFSLSVQKGKDGKIAEIEIKEYLSQALTGNCVVDGDDILHGFGGSEKDPYGLVRRFSSFMQNMTVNGPYLSDPKKIKKYKKTLAE